MERIPLATITADEDAQPRARIEAGLVSEYAEALAAGATFPPVVVFRDGADLYLADGFHRLKAAQKIGAEDIDCDIREGGKRDAVLFSVGANATHGMRRSSADKRRAVLRLLKDDEWGKWSSNRIAQQCGVHHDTVDRLRSSLADSASERTYTTKHGTVATMDTTNIGRRRAASMGNEKEGATDAAAVRGGPLPPTRSGMALARVAVRRLEEIPPDDAERAQAWALVREWLNEHDRGTGRKPTWGENLDAKELRRLWTCWRDRVLKSGGFTSKSAFLEHGPRGVARTIFVEVGPVFAAAVARELTALVERYPNQADPVMTAKPTPKAKAKPKRKAKAEPTPEPADDPTDDDGDDEGGHVCPTCGTDMERRADHKAHRLLWRCPQCDDG